jgi:tRNA G18 (ribose-2'-O)-methylase SpoU
MPQQLTHEETGFQPKKFPIVLVAHQLTSPANLGSIFRAAEAFNIEKILLSQSEDLMKSNRFKRTARATHQHLEHQVTELNPELIQKYRDKGFKIIGLEITKNSQPLQNFKFSKNEKLVILLGAERYGLAEEWIGICDYCVHIPMFGLNSSMNVSQALSIALYEFTKQMNQL